tara:strand:+ start:112 stop:1029 length:918 start_codon:yes stop_codon:yes gene_type:complete
MTLIELLESFPTDEACRQHLIKMRWPKGVACLKCSCDRVSELKSRKQWTCLECRYRFSATAGTIFHKTHIGLRKWFIALFIILNAKKGISSLEVNRQLGISQECCWHMCHRIREAMREDHGQIELFDGVVQIDDYYHGGDPRPEDKGKLKRGRGSQNKTTIVGAYDSDAGTIRTKHLPNLKQKTVADAVMPWMDAKGTTLHSDEFLGYDKLGRLCREHRQVNHDEWYVAKDGTHCNAVENAWSLFNRAVIGSFHQISRKHLHRYLSEFDSRFNSRKQGMGKFFDRVLRQSNGRMLPGKTLTNGII